MDELYKQKTEEWREWLDSIFMELNYLREIRLIYLQMVKLMNQNLQTFSYTFFRHWLLTNYSTCASLAIRRLVDNDNRTFSLLVLLRDIAAHHSLIARAKYVEMMIENVVTDPRYINRNSFFIRLKKKEEKRANGEFTKYVGNFDYLSPVVIKRDIEEVIDSSNDIKKYVNQYIAHSQKGKRTNPPTFRQIARYLTISIKTFTKYDRLITGRSSHFSPSKEKIENETKAIFEKKLYV